MKCTLSYRLQSDSIQHSGDTMDVTTWNMQQLRIGPSGSTLCSERDLCRNLQIQGEAVYEIHPCTRAAPCWQQATV